MVARFWLWTLLAICFVWWFTGDYGPLVAMGL